MKTKQEINWIEKKSKEAWFKDYLKKRLRKKWIK